MDTDQQPRPAAATLRRRQFLGLAVAAPVLTACATTPVLDASPLPWVPIRLATRWSGRPDGSIPERGDEGIPLQVIANHGTRPTIQGGALDGNLPDRGSATYVQQHLPDEVRRLGAVFGFEPGTTDGSLTLVLWDPSAHLSSGCHIALAPDRWIAATVDNADVDEYAGQDYRAPLVTDGRRYRVDVVVLGTVVHLALPDGTTAHVENETVGRFGGSIPCWEFFRADAGGASVRLYETWAG